MHTRLCRENKPSDRLMDACAGTPVFQLSCRVLHLLTGGKGWTVGWKYDEEKGEGSKPEGVEGYVTLSDVTRLDLIF